MTDSGKSQFQKLPGGLTSFSRWLEAPLHPGLIGVQAIRAHQS